MDQTFVLEYLNTLEDISKLKMPQHVKNAIQRYKSSQPGEQISSFEDLVLTTKIDVKETKILCHRAIAAFRPSQIVGPSNVIR